MTAGLLLSEIEASLGDAWRLDVLEERHRPDPRRP